MFASRWSVLHDSCCLLTLAYNTVLSMTLCKLSIMFFNSSRIPEWVRSWLKHTSHAPHAASIGDSNLNIRAYSISSISSAFTKSSRHSSVRCFTVCLPLTDHGPDWSGKEHSPLICCSPGPDLALLLEMQLLLKKALPASPEEMRILRLPQLETHWYNLYCHGFVLPSTCSYFVSYYL